MKKRYWLNQTMNADEKDIFKHLSYEDLARMSQKPNEKDLGAQAFLKELNSRGAEHTIDDIRFYDEHEAKREDKRRERSH